MSAAVPCIGALIAVHAALRHRSGFVSARRATDPVLAWLWNGYGAVACWTGLVLVLILAHAPGGGA